MCTKCSTSHYSTYLIVSIRYTSYVNCIQFPIVCCTSNKSFTDKLCLSIKLQNLKIQKVAKFYVHMHKPYFLMLGHIYVIAINQLQIDNYHHLIIHCKNIQLLAGQISSRRFAVQLQLFLSKQLHKVAICYIKFTTSFYLGIQH